MICIMYTNEVYNMLSNDTNFYEKSGESVKILHITQKYNMKCKYSKLVW